MVSIEVHLAIVVWRVGERVEASQATFRQRRRGVRRGKDCGWGGRDAATSDSSRRMWVV